MITDSQVSIGILAGPEDTGPADPSANNKAANNTGNHNTGTQITAAEAEYAARFTNPTARIRFEQRRWLVRQVLASHLDAAPEDLTPSYHCPQHGEGVHGRPGYLLGRDPIPLALSVSSYRDTVVVLVSAEFSKVGIDVTDKYDDAFRTDSRPLPEIAKTFLSFADAEWVLDAPASERQERLARVWTIKEAVLKVDGRGLRRDPASFSVVKDGELADALTSTGQPDTYIEQDTFGPIVSREGLVISLAAQQDA